MGRLIEGDAAVDDHLHVVLAWALHYMLRAGSARAGLMSYDVGHSVKRPWRKF